MHDTTNPTVPIAAVSNAAVPIAAASITAVPIAPVAPTATAGRLPWLDHTIAWLERMLWAFWNRLGAVDDQGGGRNSDEGWHISGGAVLAGVIALGVGAFITRQLGFLDQ